MELDEAVRIYQETRSTMNQEQMHGRPPISEDEKCRTGLAYVLDQINREHAGDISRAAKKAYENGQRDLTALQGLGF